MPKPKYNVLVWDWSDDNRGWVYETCLKHRPWNITIQGVRKVLRELQGLGYQGRRGDPSVLVERIGWAEELLSQRKEEQHGTVSQTSQSRQEAVSAPPQAG